MAKQNDKKVEIEIIINGTSYGEFSFPKHIKLKALLVQALAKTKNTGQESENFEMKDQNGAILDLDKHLDDYDVITQLWINPVASIGG